jgi:hypothetical protein
MRPGSTAFRVQVIREGRAPGQRYVGHRQHTSPQTGSASALPPLIIEVLPLSCGGGDEPDVTDAEAHKPTETERLVARVAQHRVSPWFIRMMEMMFIT